MSNVGPAEYVDVMLRDTAGGPRAHFHGAARCACWSACPVCSSALRIERAEEIRRTVEAMKVQGYLPFLLTLTLAHSMGDDLRSLSRALQKCWRSLWAGQPGKKLRASLGMDHYIRGDDTTYGRNGWHPHWHVVMFARRQPSAAAVDRLKASWHAAVLKTLGRHYVPTWTRGADVRACRRDEYIAKLGLEVVSAATKTDGGLNPWAIARRAAAGDHESLELWTTYTAAKRGARQLVWSRQLRAAAQLGAERTDQEIVDAEGRDADETHIASFPAHLWREVARCPGALFAVLRGAEDGGRMGAAVAAGLYLYGLAPPERGELPDPIQLELFALIAPCGELTERAAA